MGVSTCAEGDLGVSAFLEKWENALIMLLIQVSEVSQYGRETWDSGSGLLAWMGGLTVSGKETLGVRGRFSVSGKETLSVRERDSQCQGKRLSMSGEDSRCQGKKLSVSGEETLGVRGVETPGVRGRDSQYGWAFCMGDRKGKALAMVGEEVFGLVSALGVDGMVYLSTGRGFWLSV